MKKHIIITILAALGLAHGARAQYDADTENGVVSLADHRGFTFTTKKGDFLFKPYLLVQASANYNYYDDAGLDPAYNQDNVANSGFAIPYAVLGFTGRAFGIVTFNLSINAAASGGALLQQAWADIRPKESIGVRVGKFKTPFSHAYLTTLGETLFPTLPTSLTAPVILPYSLNAVTPNIGTGFDLGVEVHGMLWKKWGYQLGVFNGTGSSVNTSTKTLSDDWHVPSLLYAGRLTWQPYGVMPASQGDPRRLDSDKMLVGVSASLNVESENESTNDTRVGVEWSWIHNRWYFGAEAYYMHVGFTKRQKIDRSFDYWGGYAQAGYFITPHLQGALRYDLMERNSTTKGGLLNMPSVGVNYFIDKINLKLQAMYQYTGRTGHERQMDRDEDNLGLATHSVTVMAQYTF
ncbi:MAG: OprO/OprP family phosphate-selective porin [Muribaculaceae bacterium]|nr:OprO/OprP family phosphate-selective porin [Muribaculaceae bacterium]